MPRDATYKYCYCSTCKLKPEGQSLEQQQTIIKHEQADKRRSERTTREEHDQPANDHRNTPDSPQLEYHPHALQDDDLNDIFDQSDHDHDHTLESADASYDPADFSLTESDPDMEHIMPQFDELRFSDSEEEAEEEAEENDLLDDPLFQSSGGGGRTLTVKMTMKMRTRTCRLPFKNMLPSVTRIFVPSCSLA
jgi:hypothetical protein